MEKIRKVTKTFAITLLILMLSFIMSNNPIKAASTKLSASSKTVNSEESFSISITSSIKLAGWTINLTDSAGCTFVSASGGEVNGKSVYGTSVDGTTSLATYSFKAPKVTKDTTYTITFSGTDMCDNNTEEVGNASCSAKITVKAPKKDNNSSSENNNSSSSGNTSSGGNSSSGNNTSSGSNSSSAPKEEEKPTFKNVSKTVYTTGQVNLRSSWSTSSAGISIPEGTELKLTGTSSQKVNGYVWYRVNYKGQTKYIVSSFITETKPKKDEEKNELDDQETPAEPSKNNDLTSLEIEGVTLTPSFNKDTTRYTASVPKNITSLVIDAIAESSNATVKIEGNEDLEEGANTVNIKVTAEDGTTKIYTITVVRGEDGEADNSILRLSDLKIEKVNFEEGFDPNLFSYELSLVTYVDSLNITAVANQTDAKVEIIGNENFATGENIVTILLTSADGTQTVNYQIKVIVPEKTSIVQNNNDLITYGICGAIAVVILLVIIIIIASKRKNRKNKKTEDNEKLVNTEKAEERKEENNKKENSKEENNKKNDAKPKKEDTDDNTKRGKGRHSR